jgi:hypothetical protein
MVQKEPLCSRSVATGIAAKRPIGGDDTMAGDKERYGIGAIGAADSARRRADGAGDVSIAAGFARRDGAKRGPNSFLEGRALWGEGKVEAQAFAIEIVLQLVARPAQQGSGFLIPPPPPVKRNNRAILFRDGDLTKWGVKRKLRHDEAAEWHLGAGASSAWTL